MIGNKITKLKEKLDERAILVITNVIYSLGIKGLSIIVGFLTLPVYVKYLANQSVLGVWLTLLSMLSWIFTFDLGINNGLRNKLTEALAINDRKKAKSLISSAYLSSLALCLLVFIIVNLILINMNLVDLFNLDESKLNESSLNISVRILLLGVLVQFVLKLINSILLSLHKSAIPNSLNLISNIMLLLFMFIMPVESIEKNFVILSIAYILTTNIPLAVATVLVFLGKLRYCAPNFRDFSFYEAKSIIKLGVIFLWVQIMALVISSTNNFLISAFVNAKEVVPFQVYYKIFSLISTFFMIGLTPIWSSVTDAMAKKDFSWVLKLRKKLFLFMGVAAFGELLMLFISNILIEIWMGKEYAVLDYKTASVIAVFDLITIWWAINSNIGNGLGKLRTQMIFLTLGAIVNVPLSYYFSTVYNSWVAIVIANIISLLPYCLIETISTTNYLKKQDILC